MRIVCDNCAAKYNIDDATVREKVSGKGFKIRCKKCGHIVVVRGATDGEAPQPAAEAAAPQPTIAEPQQAQAPDAVWHLVINQDQVGPMTAQEVRERFHSRQVDAEAYAWRDGFENWVKLGTIEEFQDLAPPASAQAADPGATIRVDPTVLVANRQAPEPEPGQGLFAEAQQGGYKDPYASSGGSVRTSSPVAQTLLADQATAATASPGAFREPARSEVPSSNGSASSASSSGMGNVEIRPTGLTGARSENSVLFSLNNLQALATGGGPSPGPSGSAAPASAARPGYADSKTEGSGLIDIRAMAAQTLSANKFSPMGSTSKPDDLPMMAETPLFSPVAPSILLPTAGPSGMPKWVWGVVGGAGLLLVGMFVVLIKVLTTPPAPVPVPPQTQVAQNQPPPSATPQPTATAEPAGTTPKKEPTATLDSEVKKPKDHVDRAPGSDKGHRTPKASGRDSTEPKVASPTPPAPQPRVEAPPPPARQPKPKTHDSLDDLLDSATGGASSGRPKTETVKKDAPEQLSRDQISSGLKAISGATQACNKTPGTYMIKLTIGKNGRVSDASSSKAGDPSADCLVRAVKGARFPEFTGDPQTITYPFILR